MSDEPKWPEREPYPRGYFDAIHSKGYEKENPYPIESEDWRRYALGYTDGVLALMDGSWKDK